MKESEQYTIQNKVLDGSIELTQVEYHILLSVLRESIEQKRVQLEAINLRRECLKDDQLLSVEKYLKTEIDRHIDLLRKVNFYEQGA
ncbi:hypothetical protein P7D73_18120 [Enterococcus raffinosus]|uniref:hypothetical protein n=1 Tax=Enterococcus raffinosus TaxID=71452 RepID=UPI00288DC78A|nr:hypothetical protein [Enterococcus raffinosus]MDT2525123.1 hypothetical protein [Enterococcus raffinosus]MDT2592478.1 hypothetical protein [Enterococcus raffinosus]